MPYSVRNYLYNLNRLYSTGNAREHSYRGDLQQLLAALLPDDILITNEPARVACGAPDYVLTKGKDNIPIGYIEAKDINLDLKSKSLKEQFDRYKLGLTNLIITDYLHFEFYKNGEFFVEIRIAEILDGTIVGIESNFDQFETLIKNFVKTVTQTIKSATKLAELMAGKARLMANVIEQSLNHDDEVGNHSSLKGQMISFQQMLVHDITNRSFADIYAQTIAYGMFAARYHDPTLPTFSRIEAADLIPKSNPFLRKLFQDIAGFDVDSRIVWIVDELVTIFLATDVAKIMKTFGRSTKMEDPIIHFYETFLAEYDKSLRKARGVWYTPQPVVNFIVRAVDEILKDEFGLSKGLADNSKTKIKVKVPTHDKRFTAGMKEYEREVHLVQVLDPATGTGTFLAETIKHIHSKFNGMEGLWQKYVKEDLIPRMNGFELLMASYAMAHLKMDMLLTETGYVAEDNQRFRIFLTNSLEEAHPDSNTLFSSWLSDESNQANEVKKDTPVMIVMGNPPYNGGSKNKGKWIMDLMEDYKKEPGGKEKLRERNPKMINDDYVKFIRQAQYYINKNGEGILAFINPHGYLDNKTFRGMRWSLLNEFNKAYILDLNGNVKKCKTDSEGNIDENVFEITTGVSINIFVKSKKSERVVKFKELLGKRSFKYNYLSENSLKSIEFQDIKLEKPDYYLNFKDLTDNEYLKYLKLDGLFNYKLSGISTKKDEFCIALTKTEIINRINDLSSLSEFDLKSKYNFDKESSSWSLKGAMNDCKSINETLISEINYRPFDNRWTYYTGNSMGFMGRPKRELCKHLLQKDNISLTTIKKSRNENVWNCIGVSNKIISEPTTITSLDGNYSFPLYLYSDPDGQLSTEEYQRRVPNLNKDKVEIIAQALGLQFTPEKDSSISTGDTFAPIDIFDYIYAVLHSQAYREKYKEFLKIDFPRVPYPSDASSFWQLVELGRQMRELHLLESKKVDELITSFPIGGSNGVAKPNYKEGKVFINNTQYFDNVPELAWNLYIGGYQPAQKWLKDRKDRELDYDDVLHYQKMIVALTETDRLMKEIDKVLKIK